MVIGLLVAVTMVLAACTPATSTPAATAVPPTAVPTEQPVRHGGWLDEVDFSVVDASSVITQITAGAVDMFSYGLAADKLADIKAANLCYTQSYGTYYDMMFNPAVFTDKTVLNPFSDRKIREAMNWAIDRNYINQEIYKGGALPKFTALTTQLVDYTGVIDVVRGLEAKYAYNLDKAKAVVDAEMPTLGATKGTDGTWQFNGKPITLIFLIRNDGDGTRLPQGEYFAKQLEALGFTVNRVEKKSSELSPIWNKSDPRDGQWNIYTAGWGANGLSRDEKAQFVQMYLPESGSAKPMKYNTNFDPAFSKLANDLNNGNFTTLQQRHDMIAQVLPLSLEDSMQVFTVDLQTYAPFKCGLTVTADVGAGVETTKMGLFNLSYTGKEGGQLKSATTSTLFSDPWNPLNGSNWVTSAYIQNGTSGGAFMPDPYTGLAWPLRAEKADVVVQTGLPVQTNLNWVNLTTMDKIDVPGTVWVDWDAKTQTFITRSQLDAKIVDAKSQKATYDAMVATNQPLLETKANDLAVAALADLTKFDAAKVTSVVTDLAAYLKTLNGQDIDVATPLASTDGVAAIDALIKDIKAQTTADARAAKLKAFALSYVKIADFDPALAALTTLNPDTAKMKTVVYYPKDMFQTVKWQDGSNLSVADFIMYIIETFDYGKADSAIYDEDYAPTLEALMSYTKGIEIVSTDPLVIATYSDNVYSDAELDLYTNGYGWWPNYGYGEAPWESIAVGNQAVANKELAWGAGQADRNKVEWMSFIGGPSLDILAKDLDAAIAAKTIPYAPTMSQYLTADDAVARYQSLKQWYADKKHFWVGTGPYYIASVDLNASELVIKNNANYVDPADRWAAFGAAPIAAATLTGPDQVKIGDQAVFNLTVTMKSSGDPYKTADIKEVKFLVYDAQGQTIYVGAGTATGGAEGQYLLLIPKDVTAKLVAGSGRIEAAAVLIPVAIPAFTSVDYVVVP
jgi:hypothetical protein